MASLERLPKELQLDILEKLNFQSLPAAIMEFAKADASKELVDVPHSTPSERKAVLLTNAEKLWLEIMSRHLSEDIVNFNESKPEAIARIAGCRLYFLSVSIKKQQAVPWFYQTAVALEQGREFENSDIAALLFKSFSRRAAVSVRYRLLGFAALGSLSASLLLLTQVPKEHKVDWLTKALFQAVTYGHVAVAKFLIENGAAVNATNYLRETPLSLACSDGKLELTQLLVEKGADIHEQGVFETTPLHYACGPGNLKIVQVLVAKGANINVQDGAGGTPLHWVCRNGDLKIAQFLVAQGANINVHNKQSQTPLFLACWKNHREIAQFLVAQGANYDFDPAFLRAPQAEAQARQAAEQKTAIAEQKTASAEQKAAVETQARQNAERRIRELEAQLQSQNRRQHSNSTARSSKRRR